MPVATPSIADILEFWFGATWQSDGAVPGERLKFWFNGGAAVDRMIASRFADCLAQAAIGKCDHWRDSSEGTLALLVVLDQFSRNIHRGTPWAFANDVKALEICQSGLVLGQDLGLPLLGRAFFYLPMEHAEDLTMQRKSVEAFKALRDTAPAAQRKVFEGFFDYAVRHHEVISHFGRYPHRNRILSRKSTAEEREFLKQPGSSF